MPSAGKDLGFEELSPEKIANELFRDLVPGDKVAITTRIDDRRVQEVVSTLQKRGLVVRVIANQQDFQDFCFLITPSKLLRTRTKDAIYF